MLRNYIMTSLRNIRRQPFYFSINLIGLSVGITCCMLIMLFVKHELSFDKFHSRGDRLFRVNYDVLMNGNQTISPSVPVFVAPHLKRMFPEVDDATRFIAAYNPVTVRSESNDKMFDEKAFAWADPNFFSLLDFRKVKGDLLTALENPNTLVVTEPIARKYFGDENPIGKTLVVGGNTLYEIRAVIEEVPSNSHFTFDLLTSIYSLQGIDDETIQWNNPNYTTFILLKDGVSIPDLQTKINHWVNPDPKQTGTSSLNLPIEPLREVHFNTTVFNYQGKLAVTDKRYLYIFISIALLILGIACINYINLATARASTRAKEVGVRKTAGADYKQLIFQFLSESFLIILPAVCLSVVAVKILLPLMNFMIGKQIDPDFLNTKFIFISLSGWIILSLVAGFYPAIILSKFKPISVLKGVAFNSSGFSLRKALVIVQFTISAALIIATLVVFSQLSYMREKKLGLDKEMVVMIRSNRDLKPQLQSFIENAKTLPGIVQACGAWRSPFETVVGNGFNLSPNPSNEGWTMVGGIGADEDYLQTMGMKLLAGRNFDPSRIKDTTNEFIVNEAFLRDFALTAEEAVGRQVTLGVVANDGPGTIVGVVNDFHITSLHDMIRPVVIFNHPDYLGATLVRIAPGQIKDALAALEKEWKSFVPDRPFNYTFLDEQYDSMYRTEHRLGNLAGVFSGISVLVACLGLFALASFTSLQRAREISIRKVLGATSGSIVVLLSSGYLRLMFIAFIAAIPVSYFLLDRWLQNFAFRISLGPAYFLLALVLLVIFSMLTVGYQSYQASVSNPTSNLRRE